MISTRIMIARRGRPWAILAIAALVVVVVASASEPAKIRRHNPRRISHRHSRPIIVRMVHLPVYDPLRFSSAECGSAACGNATPPDETRLDDPAPDERYVVYPKQYERFVSRKSQVHVNRYKRYVLLPEMIPANASDDAIGHVGEVSRDDGKITRVPLIRSRRGRVQARLVRSPATRSRRSVAADSYPGRMRNASDDAIGHVGEVSQDDGKITRVPLTKSRRGRVQARLARSPATRSRRSVAADSYPGRMRNASDDAIGHVGEVSQDDGKITRVPLTKSRRGRVQARLARSPATEPLRSGAADSYPGRMRNASDYYAERRAVMARFYARQREIEARYGLRADPSSTDERYEPTSNVTLFRLYPGKNFTYSDTKTTTFRHPSLRIDPVYSNLPAKLDGRSAADLDSRAWNNVQRQPVQHRYTTPVPCGNTSGTFAPKKRSKNAQDNCTDSRTDDRTTVVGPPADDNGTEHEVWGKCKGKVVYQHNLLLGLKGPSTLDTTFEVIIQGPVCITCVEVVRYNETRAKVKLESGGRGYDYVRLQLQGYENEGFSYIIKVWGVRKFGPDCDDD